MIEVITYIAFDGTEFEDERECIDYEAAQEAEGHRWTWFSDLSGTRLEPKSRNVDGLVAVILTSEKEYKTMTNWLCEEGCIVDGLWEYQGEGLYYYDTDKDVWKYWPEEMHKLIAFGAAFGQTI
jgi:hypothetical protein